MTADDLASRVAEMLEAVEHHLRMNMAVPVPGLQQMVDKVRKVAKSDADEIGARLSDLEGLADDFVAHARVLQGIQKDLAAVANRVTALEVARHEPAKSDDKPSAPSSPKPGDKDK